MPEHNHDMPIDFQVTEALGNGDARGGMLFEMAVGGRYLVIGAASNRTTSPSI